jgi:hypothetical protein
MKQGISFGRKGLRAGLGALLALVSSVASANFTCEGKVTYLGLSPDGTITVSVGFGAWYICNQTTAYSADGQTFTPEGCRAWYASILAAQKADHSIRFFFASSSGTSNGPECNALGSWTWPHPPPYHMTVMN